jgi:hypothetical protein
LLEFFDDGESLHEDSGDFSVDDEKLIVTLQFLAD